MSNSGKRKLPKPASKRLKKSVASTTVANLVNNQDFVELLNLFDQNKVRYLIVGGFAVAYHGHVRYTKDLDIWIEPKPVNARRVVKALVEFGFESVGLQESDFTKLGMVIQLGYPPSRIDLLTQPQGVKFKTAFSAALIEQYGESRFWFIDLPNLLLNKRATGRPEDLADVAKLQK